MDFWISVQLGEQESVIIYINVTDARGNRCRSSL